MIQNHFGEKWKTVEFNLEITNTGRIEISNFGRLRTFNKISNGNIISGSMINGYRIIRLKLFSPREINLQNKFDQWQKEVSDLNKILKSFKEEKSDKIIITETTEKLTSLKKKLSKRFQADLKARTINYHSLIHRLVANYFLRKPDANQTIVAHINHNKLDNDANNLLWMTPEENYLHQKQSPLVINESQNRRLERKEDAKTAKLSVTKVMLMKKLINEGKSIKQLVKFFKVTDTQIIRIKKGENWGEVEAAK